MCSRPLQAPDAASHTPCLQLETTRHCFWDCVHAQRVWRLVNAMLFAHAHRDAPPAGGALPAPLSKDRNLVLLQPPALARGSTLSWAITAGAALSLIWRGRCTPSVRPTSTLGLYTQLTQIIAEETAVVARFRRPTTIAARATPTSDPLFVFHKDRHGKVLSVTLRPLPKWTELTPELRPE